MTETTMSFIERITIERNKELDNAIFSEIKMMAVKNGLEAKIVLGEKNIITALKKQMPKKPIKVEESYNVERQEWDYGYECPSCGNPYADDSYCSCCGQALDWSDSEWHRETV